VTVEKNVLAGRLSTSLRLCSQDEIGRLCQRPPATRLQPLEVTLALLVEFGLERARKGNLRRLGGWLDGWPATQAFDSLEWQVSRALSGLLDSSNEIKKSPTSSSSIEEEEEIYNSKQPVAESRASFGV
jgi:hypothetical protein